MRIIFACLSALTIASSARADLQQLIDRASPGETIDVSAGVHAGPLKIDKPLKLIGHGGAVIDGGGAGDVVIIAAPDVTIRGMHIRGSGDSLDHESTGIRVLAPRAWIEQNVLEDVLFGIDLKVAPDCVIRENRITSKPLDIARQGDPLRLWRSNNCLVEANVIEHGRDALLWYSDHITIRKNISRHNRYGFHMMYANDVTLEDNELSGNSVGIYLMYGQRFAIARNRITSNRGPSGYGIGMKEVDAYRIADNVISGNRVGIYIDGSPYTRGKSLAELRNNTLACNDVGISMLPAVKGNRIWDNNFTDNVEQVAVLGRGALDGNAFAVDGRGNFWSDYAGYDGDRDGIGDVAYRSTQLFESLIDREPKLRLLLFSPSHDAIEFIGRAIPAVRPQPKLTDPSPIVYPVESRVAAASPRSPWPMRGVALAMLTAAGLVLAWAKA
ncbi:MAG TPA: nitrous oxide reductase family maturation protein NosD [Tepidisphaeraceae bacterium]